MGLRRKNQLIIGEVWMGRLVMGKWEEGSIIRSDKKGRYDRPVRTFRETIASSHAIFKPESGRYHLYVSYACPWAHRCLIFRSLKSLDDHISYDVVHPDMLSKGWSFKQDLEEYGSTGDRLNDAEYLYQVYQKADPEVTTSVTVPVLWDKKTKTIINNESSEIIRIFNSAFNEMTGNNIDYYPEELRKEVDHWNERVYESVNNGVYKCGFAKTQEAYDEAVTKLFTTLDQIESHLEGRKYLVDDQLTEADLRLLPTLLRFDPVYYVHFKCSQQKISEYKNLSRYLKGLLEIDAVASTTHLKHIKRHYFYSHASINPHQIIATGPKYMW